MLSGETTYTLGLDSTTSRVLLLTVIFLLGCFEGAVLKRPGLACATWFPGLAALTAWIAYPLTAGRIFMGAIVLVAGMALMITYSRRRQA
jgi:hypothetical protein